VFKIYCETCIGYQRV